MLNISWRGRGVLSLVGLVVCTGCDLSTECLPWYRGIKCATPDLGQVCSSDPDNVKKVTVKPGSNDVVRDPGFENCDSFFCASTNGSRPYCTRRCETRLDCDPGGLPCIPGRHCARDDWDCEALVDFGELACVQPEDGDCPVDEKTGKIDKPAKYCRAKDGTIDLAGTTDLNTHSPDGGQQ